MKNKEPGKLTKFLKSIREHLHPRIHAFFMEPTDAGLEEKVVEASKKYQSFVATIHETSPSKDHEQFSMEMGELVALPGRKVFVVMSEDPTKTLAFKPYMSPGDMTIYVPSMKQFPEKVPFPDFSASDPILFVGPNNIESALTIAYRIRWNGSKISPVVYLPSKGEFSLFYTDKFKDPAAKLMLSYQALATEKVNAESSVITRDDLLITPYGMNDSKTSSSDTDPKKGYLQQMDELISKGAGIQLAMSIQDVDNVAEYANSLKDLKVTAGLCFNRANAAVYAAANITKQKESFKLLLAEAEKAKVEGKVPQTYLVYAGKKLQF
jgi:hypothetical protein